MSSIVRVKRRIDEEPLDALILKTKRTKLDEDADKNSVFRFCGTLSNQEDEIKSVKELLEKSKSSIQELRRDVKKKTRKSSASRVEEHKNELTENRYRLINQLRDIPEDSDVQVYDLVPETTTASSSNETITLNDIPLVVETASKPSEAEKYVYDIYLSENVKFDKTYLDSLLYVQPYAQEFYFDKDSDSEREFLEDDEDSNDEGNWRNEYPDTDEDYEERDDYYGMTDNFDSWHLGESDTEDAYAAYKRRVLEDEEDECSD